MITMETMLERARIEDLFARYYSDLDGTDTDAFGKYFTPDCELDVNGIVVHGAQEIANLYATIREEKPPRVGNFRMILSNMRIAVNGDTATYQSLWTQVNNFNLFEHPVFVEQGREYDKLVKVSEGEWRITKRVVIADSFMPRMMKDTYQPRERYTMADL